MTTLPKSLKHEQIVSPQGIFISNTQAERDAYRAAALLRLVNGERTSLSGGGKSGSRNWPTSPQDILFELDYADRIASGIPRPQKVVQVLSPQYPVYPQDGIIVVP